MLDARKAAILGALVEGHIDTGDPVSSRAILERCGIECSSATIRNELVILERMGLVSQPHTSAGRVPTDRGFRYYVDHLSAGSARASVRHRIDGFFSTVHSEFGRILRETSDLLSEITRYPAVVLGPGLRGHVVRDLQVFPLEAGAAMLVLLTDSGRVYQAVLRPQMPVGPSDVAAAAELLSCHVGTTLGSEVDLPANGAVPAVIALVALAADAISAALDRGRDVFVGGASRMVDLWEDLEKLHRVLSLLEREAAILELLDDTSEGTSVKLGTELHSPEHDLAIVSAGYPAAASRGRVGVLGPMRMDYRRAIQAVEEVSGALGDSLNH
ncbi:MAG: heat-inducible transcriptional repressor HrcA [Acidimicrobiia bacterium]|nr:MAG: heat-inducible transcriptional repressor HrcA [Acidimicrobiia bacterium]